MDIQDIVERGIRDVAYEAIREAVVAQHPGRGINKGVRKLIRERAREMLQEDEELQQMIRDALVHWIQKEQ